MNDLGEFVYALVFVKEPVVKRAKTFVHFNRLSISKIYTPTKSKIKPSIRTFTQLNRKRKIRHKFTQKCQQRFKHMRSRDSIIILENAHKLISKINDKPKKKPFRMYGDMIYSWLSDQIYNILHSMGINFGTPKDSPDREKENTHTFWKIEE